MNVVVSGLDVHKDYTYATILGPDEKKLAQRARGGPTSV